METKLEEISELKMLPKVLILNLVLYEVTRGLHVVYSQSVLDACTLRTIVSKKWKRYQLILTILTFMKGVPAIYI